LDEFTGFLGADVAGGIVFGGVAFTPAGVEVIGVPLAMDAKDERQGLQRAEMGQIFLRTVSLGIEQDGAELERGVVGNAKLPVGREPLRAGILQVAVRDGKEFGNLPALSGRSAASRS
jgi:hypothetical protein